MFSIETIINSLADYQNLTVFLDKFKKTYKKSEVFSLGRSVLGRDIFAIKIGRGKKFVLYAAAFHALEDLTANLLLKFSRDVASAYENSKTAAGLNIYSALEDRSIVIVPLVNPDGLEIRRKGFSAASEFEEMLTKNSAVSSYLWNSNARGVDLNHNYDANFEGLTSLLKEKGFCYPREKWFAGPYPESEPETKALCSFCRNNDVLSVYAFHSQGEEIYYTYGENLPHKSAIMARMLSCLSGYSLSLPTGTAASGGFKDWFIKEFHRPGFTFEIGLGENPLPIKTFPSIYKRLFETLIFSIVL